MNKAWLGYFSSILLLLAGILMIIANKLLVGLVFIAAAIGGVVLRMVGNKPSGPKS